ncbi:hypothetical protein [Sandarakinorhabdus sp.]|uniref:hypothetical protein n=1 Tax=Sandarakinorhabdus sp. TaxID=1916663 RepID=UPI00286D7A22|nr:hypothetical protein [Sandarakinorhabdus sp.]
MAILLPGSARAAPQKPAPQKPASQLLAGNWAGDGFSLRISGNDTVVQGKCMNGKASGRPPLDGSGRFSATGYLNPVTAGLSLSQTNPKDRPAQFSGRIIGSTLELQIKSDLVKGNKTYRLRRNAVVKFDDCGRSTGLRYGTS